MPNPGRSKVTEGMPALFGYDKDAALDTITLNGHSDEISRVQEIQFHSDGRVVSAYRVDPLFTLPMGRAIFLHPAPGDKNSFLADAKMLAARGVTSLLIDAPWSGDRFTKGGVSPSELRELIISTVVDVRRGADLLAAGRPGANVALIGHSLGAMVGGILSAVDNRFRALVLMGGVGRFSDLAQTNNPAGGDEWLSGYQRATKGLDPIEYVGAARDALFLFQLGLEDRTFSRSKFVEYFDAAGGSKDLIWYEADHFGVNEAGRADRIEWLDVRISSL